jgi:hypothetical protein
MWSHGFGLIAACIFLVVGCRSEEPARPSAGIVVGDDSLLIARSEPLEGVRDRDRDPFVLALDVGGEAPCSAALLAGNLVLTARRCVSDVVPTLQCPSKTPQILGERLAASLAIYAGDDAARGALMARGREVIVPEGDMLCGADLALVLSDRRVDGIVPRPVRKRAVAPGDHLRTVGFARGVRVVREHVAVEEVTRAEFRLAEAACQGAAGDIAIDETSGEIVGTLSRSDGACDGNVNVYTRLDVYADLVAGALARSKEPANQPFDDGVVELEDAKDTDDLKPQKSKPPSDVGTSCEDPADCGTGVCVRHGDQAYCSRACGGRDRCPTRYRCTEGTGGQKACAAG